MKSNLRRYLKQEFNRRKKKNSRYSIRSFARDLKIDPTALSRILAGARAIGSKTAQRILLHLKLDPATRETLLHSLVAPEDHAVPVDADYVELTADQMDRMDEWIYSAILELARSKSVRKDLTGMADYFGIPIAQAEKYVNVLLDIGLLRRTENGFRKLHDKATAPKINSAALKRIFSGYIDRAKAALENHPDDSHDISGITLLISRDKLAEAPKRIKEFRRSLAHFIESDEGEDLYRINVQLFALKGPIKTPL
ncbi:TIGR02147 family protein [Bdellovibrionota bacterium FG-1]